MKFKFVTRDRKKFPKCIREFEEIKGICVGGCIEDRQQLSHKNTNVSSSHKKVGKIIAHAHSLPGGKFYGWICLGHLFSLKKKKTLLHEAAHILARTRIGPKIPTHGKEWRKVLNEIGGTYKSYSYKIGKNTYTHRDYSRTRT